MESRNTGSPVQSRFHRSHPHSVQIRGGLGKLIPPNSCRERKTVDHPAVSARSKLLLHLIEPFLGLPRRDWHMTPKHQHARLLIKRRCNLFPLETATNWST